MDELDDLLSDVDELDEMLGEGDPTAASDEEDKPLVAVIDDDATVRSSLEFAMQDYYRIKLFNSGKSAVDDYDPDTSVVILDIKMPGKDGFWTYKQLHDRDTDLPIIFNSAYQDLEDPFVIINDYRPFGYITKSGNLAELMNLLKKAISYRQRVNSQRSLMERLRKVKTDMADLRVKRGW